MLDIIFEIVCGLGYAFLGATFGVLWPPRTARWASWQRLGLVLGGSAVVMFGVALGLADFRSWAGVVRWIFWLACLLIVCYMIVGNVCRVYHESAQRAPANDDRATPANHLVH